MSDAIAGLLAWFYELVPNYAFAIVLLTLVVMVVLTPLTMKGTRSMMAMQRLGPEMKKLQERYKDDREKLNEEMLRFYKEHKINPVSGCLPLFIQMPVFIVLFNVLRGLTQLESMEGAHTGWLVGKLAAGQNATELPEVVRTFDPGYLDHTSALYRDLVGQTRMESLGLDLATSPLAVLPEGILTAIPYVVLVLLVGFTSWYQQQQITARNAKRGVAMDPNMVIMTKVMPLMLPVFSVTMPAGLVVYFVVSNVYRVGQQAWINHTMDLEEARPAGDDTVEASASEVEEKPAKKTKPKDEGPKKVNAKPKAKSEGRNGSASAAEPRQIASRRTGGGGSSNKKNRKR